MALDEPLEDAWWLLPNHLDGPIEDG